MSATSTKQKKNSLSEILAYLMHECNVSVSQLSKNTGLGVATIQRIKTDPNSNPTLDSLQQIATYFSITIPQLLGYEPLPQYRKDGTFIPTSSHWPSVPLLSWEQAPHINQKPDEILSNNDLEWITTDLDMSDKAFALIMKGQSMEPKFSEGTILIFDPSLEPSDRDFVLILLHGKSLPIFRQMLVDGDDKYLKSLNPIFNQEKIEYLKNNTYEILGIMIQAKMNYRR